MVAQNTQKMNYFVLFFPLVTITYLYAHQLSWKQFFNFPFVVLGKTREKYNNLKIESGKEPLKLRPSQWYGFHCV